MDDPKSNDPLQLKFDEWDIAVHERKRNRMKLRIKLDKKETEAFRAFTETVKPDTVSEDQFLKSIFLHGVDAINKELTEAVKAYAEEHREELEASGYSFDTSGDVASFSPSGNLEGTDGPVTMEPNPAVQIYSDSDEDSEEE